MLNRVLFGLLSRLADLTCFTLVHPFSIRDGTVTLCDRAHWNACWMQSVDCVLVQYMYTHMYSCTGTAVQLYNRTRYCTAPVRIGEAGWLSRVAVALTTGGLNTLGCGSCLPLSVYSTS